MHIKTTHTYIRKGTIYIDASTELGRMRFSTKLEASKANLALVASKIQNFIYEHIGYEVKNTNRKISINDIGRQFLKEECENLKAQTLLKYQSNLRSLEAYFGDKDVRLLSQEQILDYAKAQGNKTYKIAFLNRLIGFIKSQDIKSTLRKVRIRTPLKDQREILPLSQSEICSLVSVAQGQLRAYVLVAIFSGMRTGELLALTWEDCDFSNEKILVCKSREQKTGRVSDTKTHTARYIDMLPKVKAALLEIKQSADSSFVFSFTYKALSAKWNALLESAGIKKRGLYQTRHTFATLMLTNDEEPLWVSAMLGHKSLHTTFEHYVKYIPQKKVRASFVDSMFESGGAR